MQYLDFDLEIGAGMGRSYPIVVHSAAGDTRLTMQFPYDELALKDKLKDLRIALLQSSQTHRALTDEEQAVQDFGLRLFEALFAGVVGSLFYESRSKAAQEGRPGVRLRLNVLAPELAGLPWEYLYDPRAGEYLSLSRNTPVVRYPELAAPLQPLEVAPPLRILGMIASPKDQEPLDIKREKARMVEALKTLTNSGLVELSWLAGQTWEDLQEAMWPSRGPWHIFHFIGHGGYDQHAKEGVLAFCNEEGRTRLLIARDVARLLTTHSALRLVVLNACEGAKGSVDDIFSSTASTLARRGIPAVLAMQEAITDKAAIQLTRTFYRALANGLPVDAAIAEARTAISVSLLHSLEWGTPVLFLRAPDSILFTLSQRVASKKQTQPSLKQDKEAPRAHAISTRQPKSPGSTAKRGGSKAPASSSDQLAMTSKARSRQRTLPPSEVSPNAEPPPAQIPTLGTMLISYRGHTGGVTSVAWSPYGDKIASASEDGTVHVWEATKGERLLTYRGHKDWLRGAPSVNSVAWSPDGKHVASGDQNGKVQVWDASTGKRLLTYRCIFRKVYTLAWAPDGKSLASAGGAGKTRTRTQGSYTGQITVLDYQTPLEVWHASTGELLKDRWDGKGSREEIFCLAWSPDGEEIAFGRETGEILKLDIIIKPKRRDTYHHNGSVYALAWSPDGNHILSGSTDKTVRVWEAASEKQIFLHNGHSGWVYCVAWSPAGKQIASGSNDKTVQIWAIGAKNPICTYRGHTGRVKSIAWSPDGTRIVSADDTGEVQIWQAV